MAKKTKAPAEAAPEQPYYLQRAHIKDFRSIRDAKVEFKPGLNIVIGPNGAGKTNFVVCVAEALNFSTQIIEHLQQGYFLLAGRKNMKITCERENGDGSQVSSDSRFASLFIEHTVNVEVETPSYKSNGSSLAEAVAGNQDLVQESVLFQPILISYGVPEHYSISNTLIIKSGGNEGNWWAETGFPKVVSRITTENVIASNAVFGEAFNKESILETINEVINFYLDKVRNYLIRFTPVKDVKLASSTQVYKNSAQEEVKIRGISLDFKINGDWLPFEDLSSGTQRAVYIIFESLTPADYSLEKHGVPDYASSDDRIIFIEEPELGIHPDQLHLLLSFLREQSKKHQLIITTHSPQVLDMLNDDELDRITICELDEKKGTQFRKLKAKQIATARKFMNEQGLFLSDYWRYGSLENLN